jgi:hypothetical protein
MLPFGDERTFNGVFVGSMTRQRSCAEASVPTKQIATASAHEIWVPLIVVPPIVLFILVGQSCGFCRSFPVSAPPVDRCYDLTMFNSLIV